MSDEPIYLDGSVESAMRASRAMARLEVSGETLDDYARVLRENEALTRRAEQAESAIERLRVAGTEVLAATGERPPEGPEPTTAEVEHWYITNDGRIIRALAALRAALDPATSEEGEVQ